MKAPRIKTRNLIRYASVCVCVCMRACACVRVGACFGLIDILGQDLLPHQTCIANQLQGYFPLEAYTTLHMVFTKLCGKS